MAEVLGIAGSVVGIVSLAIDLTQGLFKYYGSWKHQDDDTSDMYTSLDNLWNFNNPVQDYSTTCDF
jgi:hypothetical protein